MAKQYLTSRRREGRFELIYENSVELRKAFTRQDPFQPSNFWLNGWIKFTGEEKINFHFSLALYEFLQGD